MSAYNYPLSIIYLLTVLSAFICIQCVTLASSVDSNEENLNYQSKFQNEYTTNTKNEKNDEDHESLRRALWFLRYSRPLSPTRPAPFLRFGRSNPYLDRLERGINGRGAFLRFGRRNQQLNTGGFLRFGRKGEFLRFG